MNLRDKKIGIWGLGIVGKAALRYLSAQGAVLAVMDSKQPSGEDAALLAANAIPFYQQNNSADFLEHNTYVLPSPGIDLRPYTAYRDKFISELDLFAAEFRKPIIAVTGSIGKTSVTTLLSQIMHNAGVKLATGGNIGTGMLDLLQTDHVAALLETSSFQLDHCKTFAPELAIWTNLQPNHLDRHGSFEQYFAAKYKVMAYQKAEQKALVPLELKDRILEQQPKSELYYFTANPPESAVYPDNLFVIDNDAIVFHKNGQRNELIELAKLPNITFVQNWLIICSALRLRSIDLKTIASTDFCLDELEHRLEKVATIDGIEFYNDSKSTTPEATLAAVEKFKNKSIHLFLGGISKGIDRSSLITELKGKVDCIYCFGKEATDLKKMCERNGITCTAFESLEAAFDACVKQVAPGQVALFSPAGASFDLFENYKKRGVRFKELVASLKHTPYSS